MITCLIFVLDGIGRHNATSESLYDHLSKIQAARGLGDFPILEYKYSNDRLFQAFTEGMEAVQSADNYAYVWMDDQSPKYDEQQPVFEKFHKLVKEAL